MKAFRRRFFTIGMLALITVIAVALAPILFVVALLLSPLARCRTSPHALTFFYGFLYCEWVGLAFLFWVWIRYRNAADYLERNRQVQVWWAGRMLSLGTRIYSLTFEVNGEDALNGRCALLFSRHTSMGDTVLPLVFFGKARNENLRYVLKRELLKFPCLDIGGNRLPNLFVDRSGDNTADELKDVERLVSEANDDESVLIYPEGTRASKKKRGQLLASQPHLADQLSRWPDLLPPRLGGTTAMLRVNPGKDAVFLAHTGFEGSANLADLFGGGWRGQHIRLHFWRIGHDDIPADHKEFVFEQWDAMQEAVTRLASADA